MGGSVTAIEQGFIQDEIARSAYEYQKQIERKEKVIVGVNKFEVEEHNDTPLLKIDDSIRKVQSDKLATLRAKRDAAKAKSCLDAISKAAKDGTNLMPVVIEAVENYCTLGEISDTLRKEFGEYR
jgi:methylmalonyl-CoA mutase N-terminal domain/subunit